jgi:hypothetical protein
VLVKSAHQTIFVKKKEGKLFTKQKNMLNDHMVDFLIPRSISKGPRQSAWTCGMRTANEARGIRVSTAGKTTKNLVFFLDRYGDTHVVVVIAADSRAGAVAGSSVMEALEMKASTSHTDLLL